MKHTATMEDARCSFDEMTLSLRDHFNKINPENSDSIKLSNEYYKWISLKTSLVLNEKNFRIPFSALPNTIKPSSFYWLHPEEFKRLSGRHPTFFPDAKNYGL